MLPLARPATVTVIILSLIGGLRSFDLIWAMTRGGPGFTSDVIASVIYKQYQAGFYGLSTAGNVVLFLVVTAIILPLYWFLNAYGGPSCEKPHRRTRSARSFVVLIAVVFLVPFAFILAHRRQDRAGGGAARVLAGRPSGSCSQNLVDVVKARDYMLITRSSTARSSRSSSVASWSCWPRWSATCCSGARAGGRAGRLPHPEPG